ncbi:phosphate propanoyltransferase [Lonepinella koalarum]|uniref:Phosphate propanoyltransferase n=1 Tax=Lonepinella koalarum TaxID=53417 RepID=A0A4R1KPP8_9PAST|nr:phosphate propanoyltransferase [Lonepinella koalarum]MDH2926650.1 phosphate propanoyltransferase [Lonepinella koalarum]TCK66974.1 propanediol utilization protein [Lonepinella koalarum]TFJ88957.1 phosphate propanoyltransferase [Lonepinella koalarum]
MNLTQAKQLADQLLTNLNTPASSAFGRQAKLRVPIGVSNRHVHLSREDMDILFGQGTELTRLRAVKQPGQFAAKEMVTIKGPKGEIQKVRVLGPLRKETQIEISVGDNYVLGIQAPICMSGELANAESLEIIGPQGSVKKDRCAIVAWRHIHMSPDLALQYDIKDEQKVSVAVSGNRGGVLDNVIVRVSPAFVLEMHIDVEEANALGLANDALVTVMSN